MGCTLVKKKKEKEKGPPQAQPSICDAYYWANPINLFRWQGKIVKSWPALHICTVFVQVPMMQLVKELKDKTAVFLFLAGWSEDIVRSQCKNEVRGLVAVFHPAADGWGRLPRGLGANHYFTWQLWVTRSFWEQRLHLFVLHSSFFFFFTVHLSYTFLILSVPHIYFPLCCPLFFFFFFLSFAHSHAHSTLTFFSSSHFSHFARNASLSC